MNVTRRNARNEETLEIVSSSPAGTFRVRKRHVHFSPEQNEALGDRYWTLNVTNFDKNSGAHCKLTITFDTVEGMP